MMNQLKKLIQNKSIVTIVAVVVCFAILYYFYQKRVDSITNPVSVPFATQQIDARTEITDDMVGSIKIPASMLTNSIVRNRNNIVGKYVNYNTFIPAGSLFYSTILVDWNTMPDSAWSDIPDGETIVSLSVNTASTYGNSIFPGDKIDLYYKSNDTDGKLVLGKLVEGIEVKAVKDKNGNHVFKKGPGQTDSAALIFSVSEELHLLLRKALFLDSGELFPVPRNVVYQDQVTITSNYLKTFILRQTVEIPEDIVEDPLADPNAVAPSDITIE